MRKMTKATRLFQLLAILAVTGFYSAAQAQIVVNMQVSPSEDKLIVTTRGACSRPPNNAGCVRASGRIQINFNLVGNAKCSEANGAKWELEHVQLGGKNSSSKPASWGGDDSEVEYDFAAANGTWIVNPVSQSARHILIRDYNAMAYDIWYRVIANCVGGSSSIETDPRVKNDGTGY